MNVDIILPTYNGVRYVNQAVESVLAQTWPYWHLTIVDDNSTDETVTVINRLREQHPGRITVIQLAENHRAAGARMIGIERSQGDIIAFLDQDDRWHPQKLTKQVTLMETDRSISAVHTDVVHIDDQGSTIERGAFHENHERALVDYASSSPIEMMRTLFLYNSIRIASSAVLRSTFATVGGFNVALFGGEDWEFWIRIARQFRIAHIAEPLVEHRVHPMNTSAIYRLDRAQDKLRTIDLIVQQYPELADISIEGLAISLRRLIGIEIVEEHRDKARAHAQRLLKLKPLDPRSWVLLGLCTIGIGKSGLVLRSIYRKVRAWVKPKH